MELLRHIKYLMREKDAYAFLLAFFRMFASFPDCQSALSIHSSWTDFCKIVLLLKCLSDVLLTRLISSYSCGGEDRLGHDMLSVT